MNAVSMKDTGYNVASIYGGYKGMYLKLMPLTFEQVSEMLAYDPETGIFTWKKAPNRRTKTGDEAGTFKSVRTKNRRNVRYKYIAVLHHQTPASRVAWLLTYGSWPAGNVLFADENPSNLRISNLKEADFPSEKSIKGGRRTYKMSPEAQRHYGLKRFYGISVEQYNQMLADQGGVCAVCKQPETGKTAYGGPIKPLSVDHNHETDQVRGLLCTNCNYLIGHCSEDRNVLLAAVKYLDKYSGREPTIPALTIVSTEESK